MKEWPYKGVEQDDAGSQTINWLLVAVAIAFLLSTLRITGTMEKIKEKVISVIYEWNKNKTLSDALIIELNGNPKLVDKVAGDVIKIVEAEQGQEEVPKVMQL